MERHCDNLSLLMLKEKKNPKTFPLSLSFRKIFFVSINCFLDGMLIKLYYLFYLIFAWAILSSIFLDFLNHHNNFSWTLILFFNFFFFNGDTLVSWSSCWQNGKKCDTYQRHIPCPGNPSEREKFQLNWCLLVYKEMFLRKNINKVNWRRCWQTQITLYNFIQKAPLAPSSASW